MGTHFYRLYEGILGARFSFDRMAQTGDIDINCFERVSLALDDVVSPPIQDFLGDFSFSVVPNIDCNKVWRWRQTKNELLVEFLTPSFQETKGIVPLEVIGVNAQSLHYLNYLIADPIKAVAVYRSGVLVQIPRPERFAIHKLIVAGRRREGSDSLKAHKDRLEAAFLITILTEDRPDEIERGIRRCISSGPKWQQRLDQSLKHIPDTRKLLMGL